MNNLHLLVELKLVQLLIDGLDLILASSTDKDLQETAAKMKAEMPKEEGLLLKLSILKSYVDKVSVLIKQSTDPNLTARISTLVKGLMGLKRQA